MADCSEIARAWRDEVRDWTRRIWTTPDAQAVWENRISRVSRAWQEAERRSVVHGVRPSAILALEPDRLPAMTRRAGASGLVALPLGMAAAAGSYSASARPPDAGEPWTYRVALTSSRHIEAWHGAWERGDDDAIGRLLGFPDCCREFFGRTWGEKCDTTWAMADADGPSADLSPASENNILLRWLGLRAVPHLPCSFDCEPTRELAAEMLALLPDEERGWLEEALSWPVEWSALHGIAEIKTPVVKVSAKTDWTAEKRTVRLRGSTYPEEGARGNVFPYLGAREKRDALVKLGRAQNGGWGHAWQDNGFATPEAMAASHEPIIELARRHGGDGPVVDLGCGNGALLRRIGIPGYGVEKDPGRAGRAVPGAEVRVGDFLTDPALWPDEAELVLLMPGRLTEVDDGCHARALLAERARKVLAYCYGDWLDQYGSVDAVLQAAGLDLQRVDSARGAGVEAGVYEPHG